MLTILNFLTKKVSQPFRNLVIKKKKVSKNNEVDGDFLPPWIFFIFKYNNEQDELIPKIC